MPDRSLVLASSSSSSSKNGSALPLEAANILELVSFKAIAEPYKVYAAARNRLSGCNSILIGGQPEMLSAVQGKSP